MVLGCSVATVISHLRREVYDRSPEMASKSKLQSNLLLPVTMPLMMLIAERIFIRERRLWTSWLPPAKLGKCELKNRIVRSATNEHLSDERAR